MGLYSPFSIAFIVCLETPTASAKTSGIVTTAAQTFAGEKTFNDAVVVNNTITFDGDDEHGLRSGRENFVCIGADGEYFYQTYSTYVYTQSVRAKNTSSTIGVLSTPFSSAYISSLYMGVDNGSGTVVNSYLGYGSTSITYLNYNSSAKTYYRKLNMDYNLFYIGSVFKSPSASSTTVDLTGVDLVSGWTSSTQYPINITTSRLRDGRYQITVKNNSSVNIKLHTPAISCVYGDYGGGGCHEFGYAYLDHNNDYGGPFDLNAGSSRSFIVICGYIHTAGNWADNDQVQSTDAGGFRAMFFGSFAS